MASPVTRLVLVDDHPAILDALARAAAAESDMEVVGTASSLDTARELIAREKPDVVVCDVQLGREADGLRLLDELSASTRFLMLSGYDYGSLFRAAHERGANGYVLKSAPLPETIAAVRAVAAGEQAFSAPLLRAIAEAKRRPSAREIEVIRLVAGGSSNDEIAVRLGLSLKTVESHLRRLFDRYGAMNRAELAVLAVREGWIADG